MPTVNEDGENNLRTRRDCLSPQEKDMATTYKAGSKLWGSQRLLCQEVPGIKFKIQVFFTKHCLVGVVWCVSMVVYGYSFLRGLFKKELDGDEDFI